MLDEWLCNMGGKLKVEVATMKTTALQSEKLYDHQIFLLQTKVEQPYGWIDANVFFLILSIERLCIASNLSQSSLMWNYLRCWCLIYLRSSHIMRVLCISVITGNSKKANFGQCFVNSVLIVSI